MAKNKKVIPIMELNRQAAESYSANTQPTANNKVNTAVSTAGRNINTSSVESGNVGVRQGLSSLGLDNSKIGWDDNTKSVLYNGQAIYQPGNIVNGTSYGSNSDIYKAAAKAYENEGNPLVTATDYAAQTGVSNLVQWNGNNLSVGGVSVNPVTVTADGKAIVKTSDIENALSAWKNNTGYKSNADVVSDWQARYGDRIDSYLDNNILSREAWEYDVESDPAYQAYKEQYQREGNRAYQDAVAAMSGNTGGMMNSAAMTAGAQQLNYYNQMLNDVVPELMNQSYNRYVNDYNMDMQALNALQAAADDYYNKNYTASRDTINDLTNAYNTNYSRNQTEREWQDAHAINQQNMKMNDYALLEEAANSKYYEQNAQNNAESLSLTNKAAQLDIDLSRLNNEQAEFLNMFERAKARGSFTENEARVLGVSENADPYQAEYDYAKRMGIIANDISLDEWNRVGKVQADYAQELDKALDDYQTENKIKYAAAEALAKSGGVQELSETGKLFFETWKEQHDASNDEEKAELLRTILATTSITDSDKLIILERLNYSQEEIDAVK